MKLTNTFVKTVKYKGNRSGDKYSDGGGLYLLVKASNKYWRINYRIHDKQRTLSLGIYPAVSLKQARDGRASAKEQLAQGIDPNAAKKEARQAAKLAATNTYQAIAHEFHTVKSTGWSLGHSTKWLRMSELYLFPTIGSKPIKNIKVIDLLNVLRKVEAKGILSTAQDLQQIIGQVFRYAIQTGRIEHNPAPDLKGALKPHTPKHFPALTDPKQVSELLKAIYSYGGSPTTCAALKLSALFFQRPGNIRAMKWSWIDFENRMLTIPAEEMKRTQHGKINGKPHLIPLAKQAIEILESLKPLTMRSIYVFPSNRTATRPMSENTINAALRRMDFGSDQHVAHGFRAMARTIMAEQLRGIDHEVIEAQLAHSKNNPLGNAYDRSEYLDQRRSMMQRWADYLDKLRNSIDGSFKKSNS